MRIGARNERSLQKKINIGVEREEIDVMVESGGGMISDLNEDQEGRVQISIVFNCLPMLGAFFLSGLHFLSCVLDIVGRIYLAFPIL